MCRCPMEGVLVQVQLHWDNLPGQCKASCPHATLSKPTHMLLIPKIVHVGISQEPVTKPATTPPVVI